MRFSRLRLLAGLLAVAAMALACGGGGGDDGSNQTPGTGDGNLLANSSLEQGSEPWIALHGEDTAFTINAAQAHSGTHSAYLSMHDSAADTGSGPTHSKVYYLVQEINPKDFPEVVRGSYFVENWARGAPHQYLQFVLIAFGPDNFPKSPDNWQIRFPLAGIDKEPFGIGNAKFDFISRETTPVQGQWVPFEIPVKQAFQGYWGKVPEGYEKLRLAFEVRWDNKTAGSEAHADVYYDDLYAGPQ